MLFEAEISGQIAEQNASANARTFTSRRAIHLSR
jgi:hypothetical protein